MKAQRTRATEQARMCVERVVREALRSGEVTTPAQLVGLVLGKLGVSTRTRREWREVLRLNGELRRVQRAAAPQPLVEPPPLTVEHGAQLRIILRGLVVALSSKDRISGP
jgi:hypothetical protein